MSIFFSSNHKHFITNKKKTYFLGNWCFTKHNLLKKKKNVIFSKKIKLKNLRKQFTLEKKIYEKLLIELAKALNNIHNRSLSNRSWRIIIGPWLRRFIAIICDREEVIDFFIKKNKNINFEFNNEKVKNLISFDTNQFTKNAISDQWNNYIFLRILSLKLNLTNIKFKNVQEKNKNKNDNSLIKKFISILLQAFFVKKKNIILFNSYLNKKNQLRLIYNLKKIPLFFNFPSIINKNKISERLRKKVNLLNNKKKNNKNEFIIRTLIRENLPSLFLEHFKELDKAVKNIRLSNSINTIFCCNGLYKNEVFKYFTALELEKGSKLICGQHGGNYGISNFLSGELHEIEISDKFLSWGWQKRNDKKIVPYSSFKILNQKINKNISSKKILIVLDALDKYLINNNSNRSDYITTNIYIKFIIKFLKKIPKQLRNYIYLKPHPSENKKNIVPIKDILMSEFNNEYKFINVGVDMFSIINDYKFIILTTNNTSFLEMIGLDKPCILLVNKEISFLRNNVLENFSNLAKANIYHTSINSCVKHILKINNKINDWWENKKTIEVKTKFKKKFANNEDKDLKKLSFILKNVE